MRYNIQLISRIKTPNSNDPVLMEIELENNIIRKSDKRYFEITVEKISYIKTPKAGFIFNPLNSSGKMLIEIDENNRMINLSNYEEVKGRITEYYKKLILKMKKEDIEIKQRIKEISASTYESRNQTEKELLEIRYLYVFLGGNFQVNSEEKNSISGFLKNYNIPIIYKKENLNYTTYIKGEINNKKISAYALMREMETLKIEYDRNKLFFKSEHEINYNSSGEIKNAKVFYEGGIKGKIERKELITINTIGD